MAKRIWVNTATGNDTTYNGLSPYPGFRLNGTGPNYQYGATGQGTADAAYGPKTTYASGFAVMGSVTPPAAGQGHQLLLCEGQIFVEGPNRLNTVYGYSAAFPTRICSYDPGAPLNETKFGRASGTNRPILRPGSGNKYYMGVFQQSGSPLVSFFAIQGIDFCPLPENTDGCGLSFVDTSGYILFENCMLRQVGVVLDNNSDVDRIGSIVFRKCLSIHQYHFGGAHVCGLHNVRDEVTVEDCIFIGNGMQDMDARSRSVSEGGPDIYKHSWYASKQAMAQMISRRCVYIEGSATGLSGRGSMWGHHNVFIDCPIAVEGGAGVSNYSLEAPNGVMLTYDVNMTIGGQYITPAAPRGYGFALRNGIEGSTARRNLFVNNPKYGVTNNKVFAVQAAYDQPSYMEISGTRAYAYSDKFTNPYENEPFPAQVLVTFSNNINSPTSPASNLQIYAFVAQRAGVSIPMPAQPIPPEDVAATAAAERAARDGLIVAMMDDHLKSWAQWFLEAGTALFGHDFTYDTTKPTVSGLPVVSGTPQTGQTLTVTLPNSNGTLRAVRWWRGTDEIPGAKGQSLTLGADEQGRPIRCTASYQGTNGIWATGISDPTASVTAS